MSDDKMSEMEMAGRRLMLGFDGTELNEELKYIISGIKASGIILFKPNIQTPEQVTALCRACREYAESCGVPPLFIAVDQEGGVVARLKEPFTISRGNPYIETVQDAVDFARVTAEELTQVGINMNFAPVLDIVPKGLDSIMKERAFQGDAEMVSRLGMAVIDTFQDQGVMAVAKHFPGIGRTVKDSHFHLPVLEADEKSMMQSDIIPFMEAKNRDVAGIMLSHVLYPGIDSQWQASLSPVIAGDLLRKKIGYDGLVMTDDLDMKAIKYDIKTIVRQILRAGVDLALICHKGPNIEIALKEMARLLREDTTLYKAGKASVDRILRYKEMYLMN